MKLYLNSMDHNNDSSLHHIFDLLYSAGYVHAATPDTPPSHKIAGGISCCIAALNSDSPITDDEDTEWIEEALRLVGCPHPLQSSHVPDLESNAIFRVIQWLTQRVSSAQEHCGNEVECAKNVRFGCKVGSKNC